MSLATATCLSASLLTGLLLLAWKRFNGGMHPCFLFLGMLLIFQGGRLVGFAFGILDDPFRIELQTAVPFDISQNSSLITILLILLSAVFVYLPCRWRYVPARFTSAVEGKWLSTVYGMLILTFPFLLYKNYQYFSYVRGHGGYLSVFTDSDAVLRSAGTLVRAVFLIATNLFFVVWVVERRRKQLWVVTGCFLVPLLIELMMGFRGKVFLFVIILWFLNNLKTGGRFRLLPLATGVLVLSVLAAAIVGFRENRLTTVLSPISFISGQGISIGVTELSVEYRRVFERHAITYLGNELKSGFQPATNFAQGQLFDNDLSIFLNPSAYSLGFGTGSSYLAESYLIGGVWMSIIVSIAIGLLLRALHNASRYLFGALLIVLVLPGAIYMPRTGILEPVSVGLKNLLSVSVIVLCLWIWHSVMIQLGALAHEGARRSPKLH
jgi:hypothetical protein